MSKVISITVKHPDETRSGSEVKFEVDSRITLEDLRKKCEESFGIKAEHQRIIHNGREIKREESFAQSKRNADKVFYQIVDRGRVLGKDEMDDSIPILEPEISRQYKYMWVLNANIERRVIALDNGEEKVEQITRVPHDIVFTNPEKSIETTPLVSDLAVLMARQAKVFEKLSIHMKHNHDLIKSGIEDPKLQSRLQHVFNATRYLAALNQVLACVIIPLAEESPRHLGWRPNPVQRATNQRR